MLHHDRDEIDALLARQTPKTPLRRSASRAPMVLLAILVAAAAMLAICATLLKG